MTRILLIAEMGPFGGTRTYFEMLTDLLLRQGYVVDALLTVSDGDKEFHAFTRQRKTLRWKKLPSANGIFRLPPLRQFWEAVFFSFTLIRYRPKLVVVSTGTPTHWLTQFLFPVPGLQILHTVIQKPGWRLRRLLPFLLYRLSHKRRLVTVSKHAAQQVVLHWERNIAYIHNPTPFPEVVNNPKTAHAGRVITVGHVVDYKNPYLWLDVARRVIALRPGTSFIWHGDGPLFEEMRLQAQGEPNIEFAGRAYDMTAVYAEAGIYFQPSLLESHGLAVIEAMSHGLPCVVSDRGGMSESVVHGETGYLEKADDVASFVEKIISLLDNKDIAASFGKNAQQRVKEHFMPEQWEKRMLALIDEITA